MNVKKLINALSGFLVSQNFETEYRDIILNLEAVKSCPNSEDVVKELEKDIEYCKNLYYLRNRLLLYFCACNIAILYVMVFHKLVLFPTVIFVSAELYSAYLCRLIRSRVDKIKLVTLIVTYRDSVNKNI